jgi:hypothetical protein
MPHLFISSRFGMVFEHFLDCFRPKEFVSGFSQLFQLYSHITQGHIPCRIAHILGVVHIFTMTKPLGGVHPIIVGETLY